MPTNREPFKAQDKTSPFIDKRNGQEQFHLFAPSNHLNVGSNGEMVANGENAPHHLPPNCKPSSGENVEYKEGEGIRALLRSLNRPRPKLPAIDWSASIPALTPQAILQIFRNAGFPNPQIREERQ